MKGSSRKATMAIRSALSRAISTTPGPSTSQNSAAAPTSQTKQAEPAPAARDERSLFNRIELVPYPLHKHLFGESSASQRQLEQMAPNDDPTVNGIELPELRVYGNLMEHFTRIAQEQFDSYEKLLDVAMKMREIPAMPKKWELQTGWTSYEPGTDKSQRVPFPDEQLIFFDIENCVKDGQLPTLAAALSPTRWYLWCSDRLVNNSPNPELARLEHLIPIEDPLKNGKEKKLVIGHHVAFDRARIREQYYIEKSATRFWCTMSMNIAISGMADSQRMLYNQSDATRGAADSKEANKLGWLDDWRKRTSLNGLKDVHLRYCANSNLDKSLQDQFVKDNIYGIRRNFQELADYCAKDVRATYEVFCKLYPLFRARFPSPVTYAGMLEMGGVYLPINANWRAFGEKCDRTSQALKDDAARSLVKGARELAESLGAEDAKGRKGYENDPWMWASDWKVPNKKSSFPKWYRELFVSVKEVDLPDEEISTAHLKTQAREIPRIFGMCYGPYPLFHKRKEGWGFLVPNSERNKSGAKEEIVQLQRGDEVTLPIAAINRQIRVNRLENNISDLLYERWKPAAMVGPFDFYKLPHPSGKLDQNVGSPFSIGFIADFEQKVMVATRFTDVLDKFLKSWNDTRFWTHYRDRYLEELAVWLDDDATVGAIAPSITSAGTVTRRAVHKLWLTSANPKKNIIGSDLKSMVQVHDGWKLVGADVDSQEQWLAAIFGDSASEMHQAGATLFSNMLLAGDKAKQTDLHSVVAKEVGISRNNAKTLNYARLYGSGQKHAVDFLKQQGILESMAKDLADKLFETTKGQVGTYRELWRSLAPWFERFLATDCPPEFRERHLRFSGRYFLPVTSQQSDAKYGTQKSATSDGEATGVSKAFEEWLKKLARRQHSSKSIFVGLPIQLYRGGYESYTFNFLEMLSREPHPVTPILHCRLSSALEPQISNSFHDVNFNARFKRTIANWFVQSSAVDFLHMLLVCMQWLCQEYDINARLVISIHDEARYLVKEDDTYRCALALTLSNMYVRSAISSRMGINELPKSIAFFSQVDVDTVLRKEVNIDVAQPGTGELIPHGEALSMEEIMKKTGGTLRKEGQPCKKTEDPAEHLDSDIQHISICN